MTEFSIEFENIIINTIRENLKGLVYGSVGAVLKVHNGMIVDITYTKNCSQRTYLNEVVKNEGGSDVK